VEQLLEEGAPGTAFQSPTLLHFYTGSKQFTVTQFIQCDTGFGFQTFYAWPYEYNDVWLYPKEEILLEKKTDLGETFLP
jgi:hypothetical protein